MASNVKSPVELTVTGMTCGNCKMHVEKALAAVPGVTEVAVDLKGGAATVGVAPEGVKAEDLIEAVRDAGYDASVRS